MVEAGLQLRKGLTWFSGPKAFALCKHSSLSKLAAVWIPGWSIMGGKTA